MIKDKIIEVKKLNANLYTLIERLSPSMFTTMTLVIGDEKAAIIDTGFGATDTLPEIIKQIIDKPVICLLTHCDPDHAGGASQFNEIYMSDGDDNLLKSGAVKAKPRLIMVQNLCEESQKDYFKKHIVKKNTFSYESISDGDTFDLGGCILEAISFPGHSNGSMCFFNKKEGYAVCGDAIINGDSAILFFDKSRSLLEYKQNLQKFVYRVGEEITLYTGHSIEPINKTVIRELLILCDEILDGNTKQDIPYMPPFLKPDDTSYSIATLFNNIIIKQVAKKQLRDSIPMVHRKAGFDSSIKYNANKLGI